MKHNLVPAFCPDFRLGTTMNGLLRLPFLGLPDPFDYPYAEYSVYNLGGDKSLAGDGFPSCSWVFAGFTHEDMRRLRAYLSGGSGFVYIRTIKNDGLSWANFYAVLENPAHEAKRAGYYVQAYVDVTLKFTGLVEQ